MEDIIDIKCFREALPQEGIMKSILWESVGGDVHYRQGFKKLKK